jgi:rifampicin phosphotransferase
MKNLAHSYESVRPPNIPLDFLMPSRHMDLSKLSGFPVSSGIIEGPCSIIRDFQELKALHRGAIVVCETALPILMRFMPLMGGLIAERGGSLSIASVYARKYAIPAVFGIARLIDAIHNGDVIRIDGSAGTVDIIG